MGELERERESGKREQKRERRREREWRDRGRVERIISQTGDSNRQPLDPRVQYLNHSSPPPLPTHQLPSQRVIRILYTVYLKRHHVSPAVTLYLPGNQAIFQDTLTVHTQAKETRLDYREGKNSSVPKGQTRQSVSQES